MSTQLNASNESHFIYIAKVARSLNPYVTALLFSFPLALLLDVLANVVSPFVPQAWVNYLKFLFRLMINNPLASVLLFVILLSFWIIFKIVRDVPIPPSYRTLEHEYLASIEDKFLPEGLQALEEYNLFVRRSTHLRKIFYLPEFYPNIPLTDYPPKNSDLKEEYLLQENKQTWLYPFEENRKACFQYIWDMLTRERPVAVILGYPGMGKSTLLVGLALHAALCRLHMWRYISRQTLTDLRKQNSIIMDMAAFGKLRLSSLPILINLKEYDKYIGSHREKSTILTYMEDQFGSTTFLLLQKRLREGKCFVLFDALDEVSSDTRLRIQDDINAFIHYYRRSKGFYFNRFLITTRCACFNRNAFPDIDCYFYTIAELTRSQISELLERYCLAFESNKPRYDIEGVRQRAKALNGYLDNDLTILDLIKTPLLLYLFLIVFNREGDILPRTRRIDFYKVAVKHLLEDQSVSRKLKLIQEEQAIEYLGPIALWLQEKEKTFIHRDEVVHLLMQAMKTKEERKAENYLHDFRERSGLFVWRIGNEYGFCHHVFQEYFAARYMIRKFRKKQSHAYIVKDLVNRGIYGKLCWQEPFLLAVAYLSGKDKILANKIINELLNKLDTDYSTSGPRIISLASQCLEVVRPMTIEQNLRNQIQQLYEQTFGHS